MAGADEPASKNTWIFGGVVCMALLIGGGYLGWAAMRQTARQTPAQTPSGISAPTQPGSLLALSQKEGEENQVKIIAAGKNAESGIAQLGCNRVYFAGGNGLCLVPQGGGQGVQLMFARLFDSNFEIKHSFVSEGLPSRARVSPNGRYGAFTSFVTGHNYESVGSTASTKTVIVDLQNKAAIADLEQFTVLRDGKVFKAVDFNFWGVTFANDNNTFYATLNTAGEIFLLKGDVSSKTLNVIGKDIECPSLSPDNSKIAYKKRLKPGDWRPAVLDLATMQSTVLNEQRNIDDQIEWLDNTRVIYEIVDRSQNRKHIVATPIDGRGEASILLHDAISPAVVR
ncbi:MAG: hypothetical protein KIH69_019490 [Anaerolineae bacterium]|nr:hypothetical protein [Anaerolineae bacterium]